MISVETKRRIYPPHGHINFSDIVKYKNSDIVIAPEKVDDELLKTLKSSMEIVSSDYEPEKVPSFMECRFCDISSEYCDRRIDPMCGGHGGRQLR